MLLSKKAYEKNIAFNLFLFFVTISFFKFYHFEKSATELKASIENSVNYFSKFNYFTYTEEDSDFYYFEKTNYEFFNYNLKIKKSELYIPDVITVKKQVTLHLFDNTSCLNIFEFKNDNISFSWDKSENDLSKCKDLIK